MHGRSVDGRCCGAGWLRLIVASEKNNITVIVHFGPTTCKARCMGVLSRANDCGYRSYLPSLANCLRALVHNGILALDQTILPVARYKNCTERTCACISAPFLVCAFEKATPHRVNETPCKSDGDSLQNVSQTRFVAQLHDPTKNNHVSHHYFTKP